MTVTNVHKDTDALTMTITSEYDADIKRVWKLWEDPRQLERWWGPPTYPATFVDHALEPESKVTYYMTGPEGDQPHGYWRVRMVDAPRVLEFEDGFADDNGNPNDDLPVTTCRVTLDETTSGGTRMVIASTFPSLEAMEQMIAMGMDEGMREALAQTDAILAG